MQAIDFRVISPNISQVSSICGYLGSFDPPHKGHEWIIGQLLQRFDVVLLLIPVLHFEKTVSFPRNATFEQRIEMLSVLQKRWGERIAIGLAREVLFIRLADYLNENFPNAEISFAMGNETFEKFLNSKVYYEKMGLVWTTEEQAKLDQLRERIVVFGRSEHNSHFVAVPEELRRISSTQVRETVKELRKVQAAEAIWREKLERLISHEMLTFIWQEGLYEAG